MIGKLSEIIEKEINDKGFHILKKSFVKNKMYPNSFPEYDEINEIQIGGRYTIRLFVKLLRNAVERIDSGLIDVKIKLSSGEKFSCEILTLLPDNFPLQKGDIISLTKDEILYKQD